jgi:hypothetical protein
VGQMVRALLGLAQLPKTDASDALAVAITHAQISRVDRALQAGRVQGGELVARARTASGRTANRS